MINKVMLIGRLGNSPEMKIYESGRKVSWFSLATSEKYRDKKGEIQEKTEWYRITCYGSLADFVYETLTKGKLVFVEGKIHYYQAKNQNYTEIVAQKIRILGKRKVKKQPEPEVEPEINPEIQQEIEDIPF